MKVVQWLLAGLAGVAGAATGLRQSAITGSSNSFGYRPERAKGGRGYCTYPVFAKKDR